MIKSEKIKQSIIFLILVVAFVTSFVLKFNQIKNFKNLLALDPYYFKAQTFQILENKKTTSVFPYDTEEKKNIYPIFLPLTVSEIHSITGLDINFLYRIFGLILTSFLIFLIYIILRLYFAPWTAILGAIFYGFMPYLMFRGQITVAENLGLVFCLTTFYFFLQKKTLRNILLVAISWFIWYLVHNSAYYFLPILVLWLILSGTIFKKWKIVLPFILIVGLIVLILIKFAPANNFTYYLVDLSSIFLNSDFHFVWPILDIFKINFHSFILVSAILGVIFGLYSWIVKKKDLAGIFSIFLLFILIFLFYRGQTLSAEMITPDRFYPFVGLSLVFLASFLAQAIYDFNKTISILYGLVFIALSILPVHNKELSWFELYTPKEVEAADWLRDNTDSQSLVFIQPLMDRLITGQAQRYIINGEQRAKTQTLTQPNDYLFNKIGMFNRPENYVFIAKQKLNQYFIARTTFEPERWMGWPKEWQLYGLDMSKYDGFPKVFENQDVIIYKVER